MQINLSVHGELEQNFKLALIKYNSALKNIMGVASDEKRHTTLARIFFVAGLNRFLHDDSKKVPEVIKLKKSAVRRTAKAGNK